MGFVIKFNNVLSDLACAVCGRQTPTDVLGIWCDEEFSDRGYKYNVCSPVCNKCAEEKVPELFYLMKVKEAVEKAGFDRFVFAIENTIFRVEPKSDLKERVARRKKEHEEMLKNGEIPF